MQDYRQGDLPSSSISSLTENWNPRFGRDAVDQTVLFRTV